MGLTPYEKILFARLPRSLVCLTPLDVMTRMLWPPASRRSKKAAASITVLFRRTCALFAPNFFM